MLPTIVIIVIILVGFCGCYVWEKRSHAAFEQRFPPISDAEFMERCPPGTNPLVALKVRRIISDQLGVQYERIYPSSSFVNDLEAD